MHIVIGFSGKLGTGKDYIASMILPKVLDPTRYEVRIMAFADQLKLECAARYHTMTYESMFVNKTTETRRALQLYGTDNGRNVYGESMWLNAMACRIALEYHRQIDKSKQLVIAITDARFPNEIDFIKTLGGFVIRIDAPDRSLARSTSEKLDSVALSHASETALDSYDFGEFVINNSVENSANVVESLRTILGKRGFVSM